MSSTKIRAIIALVLTLCGIHRAMACGGEAVSNYATRPFDIIGLRTAPPSDQTGSINTETISFWKEFTNGEVLENSIRDFFKNANYDNYNPNYPDSPLTKWLAAHNHKDALEYIGYCLEYNDITQKMLENAWQYEQPDMSALSVFYNKIKGKKGNGALALRYKFLKIRTLASLKNDNELISFWKKEGKKIPDTPLGRRIKGYIGGAYYRQHDYVTALDYFDAANDPNSVAWCVEQLVGARNLANLYEHAPNSVAIDYILQDYVNYLIEAVRAPDSFISTMSLKNEFYNVPLFDPKAEIDGFIAIADRALSEGRVENPMVWATAKGVVVGISGKYDDALAILENAKSLNGTKAARENLDRFYGWALLMTWSGGQDSKATQLASFIEKQSKLALDDREYVDSTKPTDDYTVWPMPNYNFFMHFFAAEAKNAFLAQNPGRKILFLQYMDDLLDGYDMEGFLYDERSSMWEGMPISSLKGVIDYTEHPLPTDVDNLFKASLKDAHSLANDIMGTRLILVGKFKEAIPYLQKVRKKFIVSTATYPYLLRGYYKAKWEDYNFQRSDFSTSWSPYYPSNPKLDYCRDMVAEMEIYEKASIKDKARIALRIAAMLHVASPTGDCWALSDYSHSISDIYSNMTELCRNWIYKALAANPDTHQKAIAYYAMLMLPINNDTRPVDQNWDDQWVYNFSTPQLQQAVSWLRSNQYASGIPDYVTSCDALRNYGF